MGKSNSLGPLQPLASQPPQTQAQGRGQGGDTGLGGTSGQTPPTLNPLSRRVSSHESRKQDRPC